MFLDDLHVYILHGYIDNIWHLFHHLLTTSVNYYQYTLILHRHYHIIITCIYYTELTPKLSATASVAQW